MQISHTDNPEQVLNDWLADGRADGDALLLHYVYSQYYLSAKPEIKLLALFQWVGSRLDFTVGEASESLVEELQGSQDGFELSQFCAAHHWPVLALDQPLKLKPVAIPKPWGQEIWFTGIEQRGLSRITDGVASAPLPWVLSVAPIRLAAGHDRQLNLLKILDPLPEPVYGDLYFELHEEKREVYVVTHVDREAWPDGIGRIRFGFDQQMRAGYRSDEAFKTDYLASVKRYEQVRREIDRQIDQYRIGENVGINEPVPAEQLKKWHARLPAVLRQRENALRQEMNSFTSLMPLRSGDVIKVPLLTPHALQHGVRTVEFQTPVYERRILSFAQKVLTQEYWDTEQAIALMSLEPPALPELKTLFKNDVCRLEEVVRFDDFCVERLTLSPSAEKGYQLPETGSYGLIMTVEGEVDLHGVRLSQEEALLLPAVRPATVLKNSVDIETTVLIAWPV